MVFQEAPREDLSILDGEVLQKIHLGDLAYTNAERTIFKEDNCSTVRNDAIKAALLPPRTLKKERSGTTFDNSPSSIGEETQLLPKSDSLNPATLQQDDDIGDQLEASSGTKVLAEAGENQVNPALVTLSVSCFGQRSAKLSKKWNFMHRFRQRASNAASESKKSNAGSTNHSTKNGLESCQSCAQSKRSSNEEDKESNERGDLSFVRNRSSNSLSTTRTNFSSTSTIASLTSTSTKQERDIRDSNSRADDSTQRDMNCDIIPQEDFNTSGAASGANTNEERHTMQDVSVDAPRTSKFELMTSPDNHNECEFFGNDDGRIQPESMDVIIPGLKKESSLSQESILSQPRTDETSVAATTVKSTGTVNSLPASTRTNHIENEHILEEYENIAAVDVQGIDFDAASAKVNTPSRSHSTATISFRRSNSVATQRDDMMESEVCIFPFIRMESDLTSRNSVASDSQSVAGIPAATFSSDEARQSSSLLCFDIHPEVYEQMTKLQEMRRCKPFHLSCDRSEISSLGTLGQFSVKSLSDACVKELPFVLENISRDVSRFAHDLLRGVPVCILEEGIASANGSFHDDEEDTSSSRSTMSDSFARSDKWSQVWDETVHQITTKCGPVMQCH